MYVELTMGWGIIPLYDPHIRLLIAFHCPQYISIASMGNYSSPLVTKIIHINCCEY